MSSAKAPVAPWFIMPSGEIHYASNAPATRFKTSAAPSDARRVRHWLAVSRMERQASLAASAGGQARSLPQPVYVAPDALKPINSGTIDIVQVGRKAQLVLPVVKPVPNWLLSVVYNCAAKSLSWISTGWLAEGSFTKGTLNFTASALKYGYEHQEDIEEFLAEHPDETHLALDKLAQVVQSYSPEGGTVNQLATYVKTELDKKSGRDKWTAFANGDWAGMFSKELLAASVLGTGAVAFVPGFAAAATGAAIAAAPTVLNKVGAEASAAVIKQFFPAA